MELCAFVVEAEPVFDASHDDRCELLIAFPFLEKIDFIKAYQFDVSFSGGPVWKQCY
jgi:hypothetical protein